LYAIAAVFSIFSIPIAMIGATISNSKFFRNFVYRLFKIVGKK
jgi:hypothetical protein